MYPGGVEALAARLRGEGFDIERGRRGEPVRVRDAEQYLVSDGH